MAATMEQNNNEKVMLKEFFQPIKSNLHISQ